MAAFVATRRALLGGNPLGAVVTFNLPLSDLGAGAVSTTPLLSAGSPTATFTRATTAYTTLSSGLLAQVSSGTARSTYSADGLTYLGYLAEGARTNLALWSRDLTNVAWTKSNVTAAKTATGADGAANSASTLTATAGNGTVLQSITAASAQRVTGCYIKRRTGSGVINMTQDNGGTWTAVTVTAGWTAVSIPAATAANPIIGFRIVISGDAIDVDMVMHEEAAFMSSPIPTTAASATRNMDSLTYASASNFNASNGTVFGEVTPSQASLAGIVVGDPVGITFYALATVGSNVAAYDGTSTRSTATAYTANAVNKMAATWQTGGNLSPYLAGATSGAGAFDGAMGVGANISIGFGNGSGLEMYGAVRNLKTYGSALSAADVASL